MSKQKNTNPPTAGNTEQDALLMVFKNIYDNQRTMLKTLLLIVENLHYLTEKINQTINQPHKKQHENRTKN